MFNKSAFLILATAAFAVALPAGSLHSVPSVKHVKVPGVAKAAAIPGASVPEVDNTKSPHLARRAESCLSGYELTYCREVVDQSSDKNKQFIHDLLEAVHTDPSVTGPVGLACTPARTTVNTHPLCSKKMDVKGLALNCIDAKVDSLA